MKSIEISLADAKKNRGDYAKAALKQCEEYSKTVLESDEMKAHSPFLQAHYSIPACSNVNPFLDPATMNEPIELALSIPLQVTEPAPEGLEMEALIEPALQRKSAQLDFLPLYEFAGERHLSSISVFLFGNRDGGGPEIRHPSHPAPFPTRSLVGS